MRPAERAVVVGVQLPGSYRWDVGESLNELIALAKSAGVRVAHSCMVHRPRIDPQLYIGSGKAEEIARICKVQKASLVLFDDDLTPAQSRNLQNTIGLKVLDRTELILDIFAQRARTREGQLQIEMAQLNYLFPRLTGAWTHLSRQEGGIGTRGPGERQLEIDRRRVREKIARLRDELEQVRGHRATQRKRRQRAELPVVAIIGYTNAGKSTLMNAITHAGVGVQDKLFATLDPTTRKVTLPNKREFFMTDTVGFIHKLPHTLVEAFKATLEEVTDADLLLHVVDGSGPNVESQVRAVEEVLKEIGADTRPVLHVLNKMDLTAENDRSFPRSLEGAAKISAKTGEGLPALLAAVEHSLNVALVPVCMRIPQSQPRVLAQIMSHGHVLDMQYQDGTVFVNVELRESTLAQYRQYLAENPR